MIASASRKENFAALLASDDLLDIMISYSSYYPSTMFNSIEDGYSINLYDYKEYMPNYYYEIWNHEEDVNVRSKLMLNDHLTSLPGWKESIDIWQGYYDAFIASL